MSAPLDHHRVGSRRLRPGTPTGRSAARAVAAATLLLLASGLLTGLTERDDGDAIHDVFAVARGVSIALFWLCGLAAAVLGARAWRAGDRSVVVVASLVFGVLVALLMAAELTFME